MVFDASRSYTGKNNDTKGLSLNDTLLPGPSLTTPLLDILLRFRAHNFVVVADIEKAFLHINLAPEHQNYVRFLWFEDVNNIDLEHFENNRLVEYKICTVLFGLTSSPFLLTGTLIKHILKYEKESPLFTTDLQDSLHVDDLNGGKNSEEEALQFYLKAKQVLAEGGFNLRKFQSNSAALEEKVYELNPEDKLFSDYNRVLGIIWNKRDDIFLFDMDEISSKFVETPTKRTMLQSIASIYDPLGLISLILVKMKNLYQDVCVSKISWDEMLPPDILNSWKGIIDDLKLINCLIIPQKYCFTSTSDPVTDVQVHSFSDASQSNFGCSIYLRVQF